MSLLAKLAEAAVVVGALPKAKMLEYQKVDLYHFQFLPLSPAGKGASARVVFSPAAPEKIARNPAA